MKWYPSDWRADPRLRMCSLSARGLWADLISYMHEGEPYGHFTIDGRSPSVEDIAALVGRPLAEVKKALAELESRQVFSRTEMGVIVSRRMVRDHARSEEGRRHVEKRWSKTSPSREATSQPNGSPTPNPTTQKLEARSQIEGSEGSRAREPLIEPEASKIATAFLEAIGITDPLDTPPEFYGVTMRSQVWHKAGYTRELVESTARKIMDGRSAPPHLNYFEKAFANAFASLNAPVPVGKPSEKSRAETNNVIAAADRLIEQIAFFDEPAPSDEAETGGVWGGESAISVRAIPQR